MQAGAPSDAYWPAHRVMQLPRCRQLVPVQWLADLIDGVQVLPPDTTWRLLEVGLDLQPGFAMGHIPHAGTLDIASLEQQPFWNKIPDHALLKLLLAQGIRHDTTVILYGRASIAAARAAHLMLYAGVRDVRLLDGGYAAWRAAGLPVATGQARPYPAASHFGAVFPGHPEYLINTAQTRRLQQQADASLVSIRSRDEFMGTTSGYDYIEPRGEIAGALWGHAGVDAQGMQDFLQADGCMKPAADILAFWAAAGIHPLQHTVFYCGTGWRASQAFFYAWLMGWPRICVYDGGWYEWSADPRNPVMHFAPARPASQDQCLPQP